MAYVLGFSLRGFDSGSLWMSRSETGCSELGTRKADTTERGGHLDDSYETVVSFPARPLARLKDGSGMSRV